MTAREVRCCVAEAIGTFAIVFFGCGAIATVGHQGAAGSVAVNLVFGGVVAAMILCLGHVSCAHFNPAVTVGFAVARHFPWRLVLPYVVAQCLGSIVAAAFLVVLVPNSALAGTAFGATVPMSAPLVALAIEAALTFFLMLVIASVATDARVPPGFAGIAIGVFVMLAGLMAGPLTGCSMNPARSLGPSLFAKGLALEHLWLYFAGPVIGATVGSLTYEFLRSPGKEKRACPESCCPEASPDPIV